MTMRCQEIQQCPGPQVLDELPLPHSTALSSSPHNDLMDFTSQIQPMQALHCLVNVHGLRQCLDMPEMQKA